MVRSTNYAGYFWLPQRPVEAGPVDPFLIITSIMPLFLEGTQMWATPPVFSAYIAL
jgi:hypothetical protein